MRTLSILSILSILNIPALTDRTGDMKDTHNVSGKAVVFFVPSQSEYIIAMTHKEKDAIDENLYYINHYRGDYDHVVELIVTDGVQEPIVIPGEHEKSELFYLFAEYFRLE